MQNSIETTSEKTNFKVIINQSVIIVKNGVPQWNHVYRNPKKANQLVAVFGEGYIVEPVSNHIVEN